MKMRFLISPDSYKGSFTALEVACHLAGGIRSALPEAEVNVMPLADGGEGTIEAIRHSRGGRSVFLDVADPLGNPRRADYLLLDDGTAVIEAARASGLPLIPEGHRNPMVTTTFGVGELIRHAMRAGAKRILVGTGGSATVDGGTGALSALGVRFLDVIGHPLLPGGGVLPRLDRVELPPNFRDLFAQVPVQVLCDVDNPLLGPSGAARTYGPQKGATPKNVVSLEKSLSTFADLTEATTGIRLHELPGAGSAGGLAGGLAAYLGARLVLGSFHVMEMAGFPSEALESDLVITGEGSLDETSLRGKVVGAVVQGAKKARVPCVAVAGRLGFGFASVLKRGIEEVHACFFPDTPDDPTQYWRTPYRLAAIGRRIAQTRGG